MGILKDKKNASRLSTSPCAQLREAYHNCFNRWYSDKFLKGEWDKEECVLEWQKYRDCLSHLDDKHLSRFLEADGIVGGAHQNDSKSSTGAPK
ncbi:uncharacterized protein At4g33100-like isoform X2 [Nicotiana tabacum]|uniref:Uncharacterized protein At4g33100-like isoform X2 n=1 Tax=Nicotiana tabacum TaxID=4097 RepID=A0A1S3ZBZ3_TOBAC|nr:uncharacterized protein At4g33100 isoform X2 [Nicotiana tomentosiformis]XP_016461752.1 PREDICTED: uncharacterized protein At4g33100-like isoform X2 [Nicotiana tabacum]XP_019257933.1 PREDICTED: uncharacterized protein At4g33100 isoform X2 [Nicotiana attenuata]